MSDIFMVFFESAACDINKAIDSCKSYGLEVETTDTGFFTFRPGSPKFAVAIVTDLHVLEESLEFSQGTEYEKGMCSCDARFEVVIEDFEVAIDESNTMMEVQGALQDASKGYLFLPWNESISEPWNG